MVRVLAIAFGLIVILLAAFLIATFAGRRPLVDGSEVACVRIVKDGSVGIAVLGIDQHHVALIDAGKDRSGAAILAELSRRGLDRDSVTAILLTHGHPDHIAAAPLFPGAVVMALEREIELSEGRASGRGPLTRFLPLRPTGIKVGRALADADTITLGDVNVRAYAVPGHSAGSAAFLACGVLFLGDSADAMRDGRLERTPWLFADSVAENRMSLIRLAGRLREERADVRAIACAHSGVLTSGLEPLAAFARRHLP